MITTFQFQKISVEQEGWAFWKRVPMTKSRKRDVARWINVGEPLCIGNRPIQSSSGVSISSINNKGVVKRIRRIFDSPTNPDSEGNDELDDVEVEVLKQSIDHLSSALPTQPSSKRFYSQVITSTPRNFQLLLSTNTSSIPPPSPNTTTSRPSLASKMCPSPIPQPRPSPVLTSQ
ncbi:hypothetical protein O181_031215 [Austropuccinia psidii MF-1]|uniref:Uncharacterized protein n=1 Tax=Austropuccinia psidii MF-1 TaxID=1389203 RepID=A0A9Q3H6Z1_9BASI|nr:hypothetical protein [Austropuccinia psidii MF-1]